MQEFSNDKRTLGTKIFVSYSSPHPFPPQKQKTWEDFWNNSLTLFFFRVNGMRMAYGYYPGLGADTRCTESGGFDELRQLCYKLMESIASNRQLWGAQVYVLCTLLLYWFLRQYAVQLFLFLFLFDLLTKCRAILSDQPTDKMSIYLFNEF